MIALWRRLPVLMRAVLTGSAVAALGTVPWTLLVSANTRYGSAVPWAVLPAAVYLWLFWWYFRGAGWPRSTSDLRRRTSRANRLSDDVWGIALVAGGVGIGAVVLLQNVMSRLVTLPQQQDLDLIRYPLVTASLWVLMGSLVAGVAEEVAFRGYMQGPIERRHGPLIAILVTGSLFGLGHLTHPEVTLILLPYYLALAAVFGTLAYLTNSILPSLVLHAGGNVFGAIGFAAGRSEWQASSNPAPLIWETGPDPSFWLSVGMAGVVTGAAVYAYSALARTVRRERPGPADEAA